jgi:RNA polymerase sigma-70 factor, ECF subfamily
MTVSTTSIENRSAPPEGVPPSLDRDFEALFLKEFDFVARALQRLGVREADVNDVAQELFLAVHHALGTWDRSRPSRPWLMGFAVRLASNYRRLAWHRGRELDEDLVPPSPRLNDKLAAKRTVMRALDALDYDKRVALVMHDLEELTAKEISELLGVPANTVSSRVRLARDAFRAAVKRIEPESEKEVAP